MPDIPLVVIGASAGGINALRRLLPALPRDLPAAIVIVVHRQHAERDVLLARVLASDCAFPIRLARDGETVERRHVYLARAGQHLLVEDGVFRRELGPRENGFRPAIDVLFRSAAKARGNRVVGVVLSGALDDGSAGLREIAEHGGITLVQEPSDAEFGDMPRNAIASARTDVVAPIDRMAEEIVRAVGVVGGRPSAAPSDTATTRPSPFSCPDCHGVLWEAGERGEAGGAVHYRCRIGHAYSSDALATAKDDKLEYALWTAVTALEERAELNDRIARRLQRRDASRELAARHSRLSDIARERARYIRSVIADVFAAIEPSDEA